MAAGTKVGEAYIELQARMAKFESQLRSAEVMTGKSVGRMQAKFKALAPTFRKVGIGMAVAGGAITAVLGLTVKSAISFNKEMANIASLIPKATKRVIELKKAIRVMAVDVGKSTADLAQGAYQVISAFGDTADTVAILEMSARAATAGVASTTEAISLLSAVTKGYGDTSKEAVKKASDLAFQAVTLGQTTFPELAASIGRVIPLTAELGVSQEELFAVMATGTGVTGKAAEVSTQLRGIMQSLMAPTADMTILLEKMGYESGKAMLADLGLAGALELVKNEADASNTPLQKYISSIEGQTLALALTGTQADTYIEKLAAMRDSIGLTDIAFKEQTEGINAAGFAFEQAKIQIEVLGQEIGDKLLPMLIPLIKKVSTVVKNMSSWGKLNPELSSGMVKFVATLGPLLIGLGGFLIILPGLASLMISTGTIIATVLAAIATPIGLLIAMIAGLVIAWKLGWDRISKITSKLVEIVIIPIVKFIGQKIENFADLIQEKLGIPEEARRGVLELTSISVVLPFFAKLIWGGIVNVAGTIRDWVIGQAKLGEPIGILIAKVADFLVELPDPAKWAFKIGTKIWQYAALGVGIWWAIKDILSAVKIAPMALPALLPIFVGIGLALVGVDVLGNKLKEKLDEAGIDELLTAFSIAHPSLFNLTVGIKEITGLELPLLLAYIDEEWKSTAEKISLIGLAIQIPLLILLDIDLRKVFADFWEDTKQVFKETWEDLTWDWVSWENFVTALQVAWDNTDWGWFGNSVKWLMGLFKKEIEAIDIDVKWPLWPQADEDTRNIIDNIDKIAKTVEQEIGTNIPRELQLMSVALMASESSFDKNAKAADRLGNEYKGLGQTGKAAIKDLEKMGLTIDDIEDPTQAAAATMAYFSKILKANGGDVRKSILIYKGWGKELVKQGGNIKKMPMEAQKQLNIYLRLLKDFASDSEFYGTLAGKQFVWGGSPGGVVGEIEEGNKDLTKTLNKMLGSMDNMTKNMSKVFEPIIGIFEVIFQGVVNTIKAFDQEAGEEFESFVNDTFALFKSLFEDVEEGTEDMFSEIEQDTKMGLLAIKESWREAADDIEEEIEGIAETAEEVADTWGDVFEAIARSARDNIVDIINGAKTMGEAFIAFGETLRVQVVDAFWTLAVAAAAAGDYVTAAWLAVASIVTSVIETIGQAIFGKPEEFIPEPTELAIKYQEFFDNIRMMFDEVGMAMHDTMRKAEASLASLIQRQADLQSNTRDKLIRELDNYYDYRELREMDLTELLELAAKTREEIENETLESIAETAAETAEREKDSKVSAIDAITEAYEREKEIIDRKIALIKVEITFLQARFYFEKQMAAFKKGEMKEYEKYSKLYTETMQEAIDMLKELGGEWEEVEEATKGATKSTKEATEATKDYGREGKKVAGELRDSFDKTGREIEDVKGKTNQARIGIELWGEEINKIPRRIDFDIVGDLHMPSIPRIGDQSFQIRGIYAEPHIPSYQGGIPYIPRTQVAVLHRKEAVLTAPQAEEWRAGKDGAEQTLNRRTVEQYITIQSLFPPDDPVLYDRVWREGMKAAYERDAGRRVA